MLCKLKIQVSKNQRDVCTLHLDLQMASNQETIKKIFVTWEIVFVCKRHQQWFWDALAGYKTKASNCTLLMCQELHVHKRLGLVQISLSPRQETSKQLKKSNAIFQKAVEITILKWLDGPSQKRHKLRYRWFNWEAIKPYMLVNIK